MSTLSEPITGADHDQAPAIVLVNEALVDQIWQEVQGKASRMQIQQLVVEATSEFAQATVTTYVSIFVRRQVREKLASMLNHSETAPIRHTIRPASVEQAGGGGDGSTTGRSSQGHMIWPLQTLS
jgi:hypothetical protein